MSTVLVVDDEYAIVEALQGLLAEEGYTVLTASDGWEALEVLERQVVDVVVADLMMPRMDGIELLRAKRVNPRIDSIPTILMSAVPRLVASRKLEPADRVVAFLRKPFEADELIAAVRWAIENRRNAQ